jgi:hypothetical protein
VRAKSSTALFGPTLRAPSVGSLPLFGQGCYAFDPDSITGGNFSAHLGGQFTQPRAIDGVGLLPSNYSTESLADMHSREVLRYCVQDPESQTFYSPPDRVALMATHPPTAFLACVAVAIKPEENGDPLYGETFLTVLAAPHAAPMGGAPLAPTDVWPGLKTLGPAGFACRFGAAQLLFVDDLDSILDSGFLFGAPSLHHGGR